MTWLRIGQSANLMRGLRPVWDANLASGSPLFHAPAQALTTFALPRVIDENAPWQMPTVSVHRDPASLASAAFGHGATNLQLGALMPDKDVRRFLGIDAGGEVAFVLVRLRRICGECTHEALTRPPRRGFDRKLHLTRAGRLAEARLRPGPRPRAMLAPRLSAPSAQRYLEHFDEYGTHFVSRVLRGDVLLQAFAFDPARLRALMSAIGWSRQEPELCGERALACGALTAAANIASSGPIISLNRDPEAAASIASGDWHDKRLGGPSLLAPFTERGAGALGLLAHARCSEPFALELTPLSRFLEFYRAANWELLLAGALGQRYGDMLDVRLRATDKPCSSPDRLLLRPVPGGWNASGRLAVYHERVRGRDLGRLPAELETCAVLSHTLELGEGETVHVPGERVTLAARVVRAEARTTRRAPRLVVSDAAFATFTLIAGEVQGMLTVVNRSRTARRTVIGGLVLETANDGAVRVGSATYSPGSGEVASIVPLLVVSLRTVERLLCHRGPEDDGAVAAADYLDWVASLHAPEAVAARALDLAAHGLRIDVDAHDAESYLTALLEAELDGDLESARRAHAAFWHASDRSFERPQGNAASAGVEPAARPLHEARAEHAAPAQHEPTLSAVVDPRPLVLAELHLLRAHALTVRYPSADQI